MLSAQWADWLKKVDGEVFVLHIAKTIVWQDVDGVRVPVNAKITEQVSLFRKRLESC